MKKQALILFSCLALFPTVSYAQTSQPDLYNSIENAFKWQNVNADALSSPGTASSDYFVMALSRMGATYDYDAYVRVTESIVPSTKQDGQRLIMSNAAAGEFLSSSFVGWYTYNADFDVASDLAGAIITLKSGNFSIENSDTDIYRMVGQLLTYQQSNGSFGNDVLSTAKAVTALSYFRNTEFEIQGESENEKYVYNADSSIEDAVVYLSGIQSDDGGFRTVYNTAFSVIALDSVGIDSDTDTRFVKNGATPTSFLLSMQLDDGSFNGSAEDTAISSCALVSRLRAMQGKSPFFDFTSNDKVTKPLSGSTVQQQPSSSAAASTALPKETQQTIKVTPIPTRSPQHSEIETEQYGPFPFVGPEFQSEKPKTAAVSTPDNGASPLKAVSVILIIILGLGVSSISAFLVLLKKNPDFLRKLKLLKKQNGVKQKKTEEKEPDLLSSIDSPAKVVPTEDLYDPDFIKTLIPVDEIDSSVGSLIPKDDEEEKPGE